MPDTTRSITAAIARREQPFELAECQLAAPQEQEVRLRMEAVGICHTDLAVRDYNLGIELPAILGHEGVGTIEALGSGVNEFSPGDRVLVSFSSCGHCHRCQEGAPAYCRHALHAFQGKRADGSTPAQLHGTPLPAHFFGQSSFASESIASTVNMVKLDRDLPAHLMAPLACGVQTGMSTITQVLAAKPQDKLAVFGCGTVGLAAIMAAKIVGCRQIIAVDLKTERLALARQLGATDTLQPEQQANEAKPLLRGLSRALDTTANPGVIASAFKALGSQGKLACAGVSPPGSQLPLDLGGLLFGGKTLSGTLEGDAVPRQFIPQMIAWYRQGKLPLEELVRTYDFADINQAVGDLESGKVIKPVLIFPDQP